MADLGGTVPNIPCLSQLSFSFFQHQFSFPGNKKGLLPIICRGFPGGQPPRQISHKKVHGCMGFQFSTVSCASLSQYFMSGIHHGWPQTHTQCSALPEVSIRYLREVEEEEKLVCYGFCHSPFRKLQSVKILILFLLVWLITW